MKKALTFFLILGLFNIFHAEAQDLQSKLIQKKQTGSIQSLEGDTVSRNENLPHGITNYEDPFSISLTRTSESNFDVKITKPDGNVSLSLYSITGLKLLSESLEYNAITSVTLEMGSFPSGLYYITIIDKSHKKTIKFVK